MQWFLNNVHQGEVDREGRYGWSGVGGEISSSCAIGGVSNQSETTGLWPRYHLQRRLQPVIHTAV